MTDGEMETAMKDLRNNKGGVSNSSKTPSTARLAQWLFTLMAHVPTSSNESSTAQKGKVFLYCHALANLTEYATDSSLKAALLEFKFFPTVSELSDFLEAQRDNDPDWIPPAADFEHPTGYDSVFNAWRDSIGSAAYLAWLRGAKVWIQPDKSIHIEASSPLKARWIRENYVLALENIAAQPVSISSHGEECVSRSWPHKGPRTVAEAWYQANERWKNDTKVVSSVSIENLFRWDDA